MSCSRSGCELGAIALFPHVLISVFFQSVESDNVFMDWGQAVRNSFGKRRVKSFSSFDVGTALQVVSDMFWLVSCFRLAKRQRVDELSVNGFHFASEKDSLFFRSRSRRSNSFYEADSRTEICVLYFSRERLPSLQGETFFDPRIAMWDANGRNDRIEVEFLVRQIALHRGQFQNCERMDACTTLYIVCLL